MICEICGVEVVLEWMHTRWHIETLTALRGPAWPRGSSRPPEGWPHAETCTVTDVARSLALGGTATTGFGCNCGGSR